MSPHKLDERKTLSGSKKMLLIALTAIFAIFGALFLWIATLRIPDIRSFDERKVTQSTKIYDRTGTILLYDVHANIRRTVVPFETIAPKVKEATIAIEDETFYTHRGVRPLSFLRAAFVNLTTLNFSQGGSTITQQVIKNSLLTNEKKIARKIKEWVLAVKIERMLTKDEILAIYLNEVPYGGNLYGVEEASQAFFDKASSDITLTEAAYLAALPQAPTYYSPYGNNRENLETRKNLVLDRMLAQGFINNEEHAAARAERVTFKPRTENGGMEAPHFVLYIREYLEETYGKSTVETGGLKVITTLDAELQKSAEELVKQHALRNEKQFNAENASLVAVDPKTGGILVMVGSRDYWDTEIDGNFNVAIAPNRQPGSAFKPFVYATAFTKGYTPETVVFDLKTQFSTSCEPSDFSKESPCFSPDNYDNSFRGPMSLRNALAQSVNIPAVKVLYLAGLRDSLETAQAMGVTSLSDWRRYGLTLVLGGGEVSLLEMTGAYSVFANEGMRIPVTPILKVEDSEGVVLEEHKPTATRALPHNTALQISDILSDNNARAPAFGENSLLNFPNRSVAVKTGTTNDYRDAWIIGYTPEIAVGAWAGNNDSSPMEKRVAGFIIAPLWNAFMQEALKKMPASGFPAPESTLSSTEKPALRGVWKGGVTFLVDKLSGKLATEHTPQELIEERVVTNVHSILYWVSKDDPMGPPPQNPANDSQFTLWEYPIGLWATTQGFKEESSAIIPTEQDNIHGPDRGPNITVRGIEENRRYMPNDRITVSVEKEGRNELAEVEIFVNGAHIGSVDKEPFSFSFLLENLGSLGESNEVRVVAYNTELNKTEKTIQLLVKMP